MDPMKYTMEELVKALVAETINETNEQVYDLQQSPNPNLGFKTVCSDAEKLAEKIYLALKNIHPCSSEAKKVIEQFEVEIDFYSYYPQSQRLLCAIEDIVWRKYKDDPRPILDMVSSMIGR